MPKTKPALFKTSVINDQMDGISCIDFARGSRRAERRANTLKEYEASCAETALLLDKAEGFIRSANGKVEQSNVILIPGEDHTIKRLEKFRRLDLNGDGKVTPEEFMAAEIMEAA